MRWKAMLWGLGITLAIGVGCKQQCYITKDDLLAYKGLGLQPHKELEPVHHVIYEKADVPKPSTILDPDRPIRPLTLKEAIAIALEQGTVGIQNFQIRSIASYNDNLESQFGISSTPPVSGNIRDDNIRVFALDPAFQATNIERSLSRFDARWITSMSWRKTDRPVGTILETFQAEFSGVNALNIDNASFNSGIFKPLPAGGVAGITFTTDYELSNLNPRVNPSYRPNLRFAMEQPLLRGFGTEINQLLGGHPNSILNPLRIESGGFEGILITRIGFDISRAVFETNVAFMLLNVETAYWNLYGSYWTLYSREQGLRQAYEAWKINKARYEAGRISIQEFALARQQYESFRSQRMEVLGRVLESERQLRGLLGLPVEDGYRLVPVDEPNIAPYEPDWGTALNEALALRPELVQARHSLKISQLQVIREKNFLLPDLRLTGSYDINGLGPRLDGPGSLNAFRNFASNHFNSWDIGVRAEFPLGFRDANAAVRAARLRLAQNFYALRDQERKAQLQLALAYRTLVETHAQIGAQRASREAAAVELDARFREFLVGRGTLDFLLQSQQRWADALASEYNFIVQYNQNLALFQFSKGTILQYNNVHLSEGPLPECVQQRASEHLRQREKAIPLLERAIYHPECQVCADPVLTGDPGIMPVGGINPNVEQSTIGVPRVPTDQAPSLAAVLQPQPTVPTSLPPGPDLHFTARPTTPASPNPVPLSPDPTKPFLPALPPHGAVGYDGRGDESLRVRPAPTNR
ncbi:MAG: TolC family protein [Gemmataceae bacterium]